jgi:acetylornithine/succinyldiaminopimelate/putrescine aminotransferase
VATAFSPGDHASTFGGNPLACVAGLAAMEVMLQDGVVENAARIGEYFKSRLLNIAARYAFVTEVRGLGLILGMDLTIEGKDIVDSCRERGLLINCIDNHILRFLPPLIIGEAEVDQALGILEQVLNEVKK